MDAVLWKLNDALTNLGDSAILIPLAGGMTLWLLVFHSRQASLAWVLAILVAAVPIAALKFGLQACDHGLVPLRVVTPSGHAALGTAVYGGLAILTAREYPPAVGRAAIVGAAAIIAGICVTRLIMNVHSPWEVLIGLAVGTLSLLVLRRGLAQAPACGDLRLGRAALVFGGVGALMLGYMLYHDWGFSPDGMIRQVAQQAGATALECRSAEAASGRIGELTP